MTVTSILPRLPRYSTLKDGVVDSREALAEINRRLTRLDRHMAKVEHNFIYWKEVK